MHAAVSQLSDRSERGTRAGAATLQHRVAECEDHVVAGGMMRA
jgi:hypothetical protein